MLHVETSPTAQSELLTAEDLRAVLATHEDSLTRPADQIIEQAEAHSRWPDYARAPQEALGRLASASVRLGFSKIGEGGTPSDEYVGGPDFQDYLADLNMAAGTPEDLALHFFAHGIVQAIAQRQAAQAGEQVASAA